MNINFKTYQKKARETAIYPEVMGKNFIYPLLGLTGETGELTEKIKKILRDKNAIIDEGNREALKKEMGDILWYLANLATELNLSLEDVAKSNLKKLSSRKQRNKLHGEGDER